MKHPYPCQYDSSITATNPETDFCTCTKPPRWIEGYPNQEGHFWVTLNWGKVSSVELARVQKISNRFLADAIGNLLFEDDILAYWSEPVILNKPSMYKK